MTSDIHRPELHFAPESGILEAPAGVLLDGDTWHLFFQYRPGPDQPSRWGHTYSAESPFDWLECDDALAPAGGETGLRAGAVAAVDGGINLYFTSVTEAGTTINLARYSGMEDICEVSDDLHALDPHVVRHGPIVKAQEGFERFRTPCVVPDWAEDEDRTEGHEGWLMLALTGPSGDSTPVVLTSPDGSGWTFRGELDFAGDAGFSAAVNEESPTLASPRIIRLKDEVDGQIYDILFVTLEHSTGEISGYLVGTLEDHTFRVVTGFQRLDYGHDFTRPRNTNITPGTIPAETRYDSTLIFGLLNGYGRGDDGLNHPTLKEEGWANVLSLPRHLTLQGGKLYQTPAKGLPDAVATSSRARSWTGLMEVPEGSSVTVKLLDANQDVAAVITHSGAELTLDRSMDAAFDGLHTGEAPASAPLAEDDSDTLTVVVDGSTVEVYADGGQVAMASRVYFDGGCGGFEVETSGDAVIERDWERCGS